VGELLGRVAAVPELRQQRLFPVTDAHQRLLGVVPLSAVLQVPSADDQTPASRVARTDVTVAYPDETLRSAADRMAQHWVGALPVVERDAPRRLVGVITEFDLLKARQRQLVEERKRERVLRFGRGVAVPLGTATTTTE
jgi:CIC family chloride channel protein